MEMLRNQASNFTASYVLEEASCKDGIISIPLIQFRLHLRICLHEGKSLCPSISHCKLRFPLYSLRGHHRVPALSPHPPDRDEICFSKWV